VTFAHRKRLSDTRASLTHHATIYPESGGETDLYLIVGLYEDGYPGELFIKIGKWGSTMHGLLDTIGVQSSLLLQYGVPLKSVCDKFRGVRFEPFGKTDNPDIPTCLSIIDYIFSWIAVQFEKYLEPLEEAEVAEG